MAYIDEISILTYVIITITIIWIIIILSFKFKYPFWSKMDAFHTYKWWYWLYNEQFINNKQLTRECKYFNNSFKFNNLTYIIENNNFLNNLVEFINEYYMNYNDAKYNINNSHIQQIVNKHGYITTVSVKNKNFNETNNTNEGENLQGCIISIPIYFWCNNFKNTFINKQLKYPQNNDEFININYVDFLCVSDKHRKKEIASQLIYTHLTNMYEDQKNTHNTKNAIYSMVLFKNEGFKTKSLVPIVEYNGYIVNMNSLAIEQCRENITILEKSNMKCVHVEPQNKLLLMSCINNLYDINVIKKSGFNFASLFTKKTLINIINNNDLLVYCLIKEDKPQCFYFFKNIHSLIDTISYEFMCIASIDLNYNKRCSKEFIYGFKIASVMCMNQLNELYCTNTDKSYDICCIEELSHNFNIIHSTSIQHNHKYKIPLTYYSYNAIIHTKKPNEILIIS